MAVKNSVRQASDNGGARIVSQTAEAYLRQFLDDAQIRHYLDIAAQDSRLAELYRQVLMNEQETLNPIQAEVEDGQVWAKFLAELPLLDDATSTIRNLYENTEQIDIFARTGRFVSGRVMATALPHLIRDSVRVDAPRLVGPLDTDSFPAIHADRETIREAFPPNGFDGKGVIVGIVDVGGADFKHPYLRDPNGASRLLFLWDQTSDPDDQATPPANSTIGREFSQAQLNAALETPDPYAHLKYEPVDGAHGTHVLDIAAGSSDDYPGIAPAVELIFVHFGLIRQGQAIDQETDSLGDTTRLHQAIEYIFRKADALAQERGLASIPVVVNISLGTAGGPHDGSTLVEQACDTLLEEKPGRAIVMSAGNYQGEAWHCNGVVDDEATIDWNIPYRPPVDWWQRQEMEIWYDAADRFQVTIETPDGDIVGPCPLGETVVGTMTDSGTKVVDIFHYADPDANKNHIDILVEDRNPDTPLGIWRVHLVREEAVPGGSGEFHAWIERNDDYQSQFVVANETHTLSSIACARHPIVVGSFDSRHSSFDISSFSSAGPSLNPAQPCKPDICAPGEMIEAARSRRQGRISNWGTSFAAPHVTGVIALLFQAAQAVDQELDITVIRNILWQTAERDPPENAAEAGEADCEPQYGFGRVNAVAALKQLQG